MEKLLHYVWRHRIFPLHSLLTTGGAEVEVIDPGMANKDAGPDFFNAKVRIGGVLWAGNVEIHLRSSDWYRHGHEADPAYDNVVLHVVQTPDCEVVTHSGKTPPQLVLDVPAHVQVNYHELCTTEDYPRCHRMVAHLPALKVHAWMDALLAERLQERAQRVLDRVQRMEGDWERATFVTLARNLGFGLNGDTFEAWAQQVPMQAVGKHRDDEFQVRAMFLGIAGLADMDEAIKKEYTYLAYKFSLPEPMARSQWRYLRTRPQNFPHVRLEQMARLYCSGRCNLSAMLEARDVEAVHTMLEPGRLSRGSRELIVINTVVPTLYAYGISHHRQDLMERATAMLEGMKPENNYIMRQWQACGLAVKNAADSQALIQLKKEYCDRHDCLRCRFAYEYLRYGL